MYTASKRYRCILPCLIGLPVLVGCNVEMPRLRDPGHLYSQQLRATYHDPYPNTHAAPNFQGDRPRNFQVPRAEPVQTQWYSEPVNPVEVVTP